MLRGRLRMILALFLFVFLISAGCASTLAPRIQYEPDHLARETVTILYHATSFKTELVDGIAKILKARGVRTVSDDIQNADIYPPSESDLIVLVVSVWAGRANKEAVKALESHPEAENWLVVSTSGRGTLTGLEGEEDFEHLDAVTGASDFDEMGGFVQRISRAIFRRLDDSR